MGIRCFFVVNYSRPLRRLERTGIFLPRFFTGPITGDRALITGGDASHITKSLRLRLGEAVTLCDGCGFDYEGRILSLGDPVEVELLGKRPTACEPQAKVTLFQAMPKGDKLEWIIQKSVELGVYQIVPVLTARCISRPSPAGMEKKLARYQKIADEAAKQCGRGILPKVAPLVSLEEAVGMLPEKSLVFYEKGGQRLCRMVSPDDSEWGIFVGSEGGFSPEEIQFLERWGVCPATLGSRILRCETAPLCGLSVLFSLLGEI